MESHHYESRSVYFGTHGVVDTEILGHTLIEKGTEIGVYVDREEIKVKIYGVTKVYDKRDDFIERDR